MKTVRGALLGLGLLVFMIGCSENRLKIRNDAASAVKVTFRGEVYRVAGGKDRTIEDIPNGEYHYGTVAEIPVGIGEFKLEGDVEGSLSFSRDESEYILLYGSIINDTTYILSAVKSSSDPVSIQSPNSPTREQVSKVPGWGRN